MRLPKMNSVSYGLSSLAFMGLIATQIYISYQSKHEEIQRKDQEVKALVAKMAKDADEMAVKGAQRKEQFTQDFEDLKDTAGK